jgi:hypothetical protein
MLAVAAMTSSAYAAPKGIPVYITNDPSTPIPVNGNVSVSGTANVNVTNPVTVANTAAAPIPVVVTNPAPPVTITQPALEVASGYCNRGAINGVVRCPLYTVPAGKRLIVDQVSYYVTHDIGVSTDELIYGLDNSAGDYMFWPSARTVYIHHPTSVTRSTVNGYGNSPVEIADGTQSIQLVFEAGETFSAQYTHSSNSNWVQTFMFQGHLITP